MLRKLPVSMLRPSVCLGNSSIGGSSTIGFTWLRDRKAATLVSLWLVGHHVSGGVSSILCKASGDDVLLLVYTRLVPRELHAFNIHSGRTAKFTSQVLSLDFPAGGESVCCVLGGSIVLPG